MNFYLSALLLVSLSVGVQSLLEKFINPDVNSYLKSRALVDDPEASLDAIGTYVRNKCKDSQDSCFFAKARAQEVKNLKKALEVWGREPDKGCTYSDFMDWRAIDKFLGERYRKVDINEDSLNPLEKLARHFATKHANQCQSRYITLLEYFYPHKFFREDMDKTMEYMKAIVTLYRQSLGNTTDCDHYDDDRMKFVCNIQQIDSLDHRKFAIAARKWLKDNANDRLGHLKKMDKVMDEKSGKMQVDQEGLAEALRVWIYSPCARFASHISIGVRPAAYDFDLLYSQPNWFVENEEHVNLYYHIAQFKFCSKIAEKEAASISKSMIGVVGES